VLQIFVAALEGAVPVLTTEKMRVLLSLCKTFGFIDLLSQVPDFISAHSVADSEAQQRVSRIV
jgi:hypothetical protein